MTNFITLDEKDMPRNTIGDKTADEILSYMDNAVFFTAVIRYSILSDHEHFGQ